MAANKYLRGHRQQQLQRVYVPHGQDAYERVLARQIFRLLDLKHVRNEIAEADYEQGEI